MFRAIATVLVMFLVVSGCGSKHNANRSYSIKDLRGKVVHSYDQLESSPGAIVIVFYCDSGRENDKLIALKTYLDKCPGTRVMAVALDDGIIRDWQEMMVSFSEDHTSSEFDFRNRSNAVLFRSSLD